jgi:hypothetical protein
MPSAPTDDAELLEVFTSDGHPTGRSKRRLDLHRDGDWHQTRTVWVVLTRDPEGPCLVLQERGADKDTWPGLLDASSAGHIAPGETDTWRELEEELGVRPAPADPTLSLGVRRYEQRYPSGLIDREHQELWLWLSALGLADLRPVAPELAAAVAAPMHTLSCLLRGEISELETRAVPAAPLGGAHEIIRRTIRPHEFVPASAPYVAHLADLAARALAAERPLRYDPSLKPRDRPV